jgi:glutamyl-tRNA reductase
VSVVVVGLQHRRSSLDVLERASVGEADAPKVWGLLRECANLQEAVLLSTCLRTEVYAVVDRFHDAVDEIQAIVAGRGGLDVVDLADQWDIRFDDDVAVHLFNVASGLESAVIGETEILGQVRRSWQLARDERMCGPVLGDLFRHAVLTGKRVRSETAVARGTTSFAHAAVQLAQRRRREGLGGSRVVVAGAGVMGSGVVGALRGLPDGQRPDHLVVVSRQRSRAERAVEETSASGSDGDEGHGIGTVQVGDFHELPSLVAEADVLVTALDVTAPVLGPEQLGDPERRDRPLLAVDMGLPRNISPGARALEGVEVLDMGDLRSTVDQAIAERHNEVEEAQGIIQEEVRRYRESTRARGAAPVVAALRDRLEVLRSAELERRRGQFGDLTDEQWSDVDAVTRAVLGKLVHDPTVALKASAGTPRGERLVEALRQLFDL